MSFPPAVSTFPHFPSALLHDLNIYLFAFSFRSFFVDFFVATAPSTISFQFEVKAVPEALNSISIPRRFSTWPVSGGGDGGGIFTIFTVRSSFLHAYCLLRLLDAFGPFLAISAFVWVSIFVGFSSTSQGELHFAAFSSLGPWPARPSTLANWIRN